jgi:hypothetical protein
MHRWERLLKQQTSITVYCLPYIYIFKYIYKHISLFITFIYKYIYMYTVYPYIYAAVSNGKRQFSVCKRTKRACPSIIFILRQVTVVQIKLLTLKTTDQIIFKDLRRKGYMSSLHRMTPNHRFWGESDQRPETR